MRKPAQMRVVTEMNRKWIVALSLFWTMNDGGDRHDHDEDDQRGRGAATFGPITRVEIDVALRLLVHDASLLRHTNE